MTNHISDLIDMTNFKENLIKSVKTAAGKSAETAFTTLFCSAFVLYRGKSRVDEPTIKHDGDGGSGITPLDGDILYFHPGVTATTSIDGSLRVVQDFPKGVNHNGRAIVNTIGGDSQPFNKPDTSKPIGRNGARGMYTHKQPHELTADDYRILRGE